MAALVDDDSIPDDPPPPSVRHDARKRGRVIVAGDTEDEFNSSSSEEEEGPPPRHHSPVYGHGLRPRDASGRVASDEAPSPTQKSTKRKKPKKKKARASLMRQSKMSTSFAAEHEYKDDDGDEEKDEEEDDGGAAPSTVVPPPPPPIEDKHMGRADLDRARDEFYDNIAATSGGITGEQKTEQKKKGKRKKRKGDEDGEAAEEAEDDEDEKDDPNADCNFIGTPMVGYGIPSLDHLRGTEQYQQELTAMKQPVLYCFLCRTTVLGRSFVNSRLGPRRGLDKYIEEARASTPTDVFHREIQRIYTRDIAPTIVDGANRMHPDDARRKAPYWCLLGIQQHFSKHVTDHKSVLENQARDVTNILDEINNGAVLSRNIRNGRKRIDYTGDKAAAARRKELREITKELAPLRSIPSTDLGTDGGFG